MDDMVKQRNRELCERYPFLIPWNRWTGELITDSDPEFDYEYTELDNMPDGWRKAFGEQMCGELLDALIKDDDLGRWKIFQLKEKYGRMELYDNGYKPSSIVPDIIEKYGRMSERTCIACGEPATVITLGWISPYCDKCCPNDRFEPIEQFYMEDDDIG